MTDATAPTPSPPQQGGELSEFIGRELVQYVAELSDRTSPEDQPLMMLATAEELEAGIRLAFERWQESDQSRRSTPDTGEREEAWQAAKRILDAEKLRGSGGFFEAVQQEALVVARALLPTGRAGASAGEPMPSSSTPPRRGT